MPEPLAERLQGEQLHPRRGQLDREWDAVEPSADLRHSRGIELGQLEARAALRAPVPRRARRRACAAASPDRRPPPRAGRAAVPGTRARRAIRSGVWLVTSSRNEDDAASSSLTNGAAATTCSKLSSTISVAAAPIRSRDRVADRPVAELRAADRLRERLGDELGLTHGREVDEDDRVVVVAQCFCRGEGQSGLAAAAESGQRDEARRRRAQEHDRLAELALTADERGGRRGQARLHRRRRPGLGEGGSRRGRRGGRRQARDSERHAGGLDELAAALVAILGPLGERALEHGVERLRAGSGRTADSFGGLSSTWARITAMSVAPANGFVPGQALEEHARRRRRDPRSARSPGLRSARAPRIRSCRRSTPGCVPPPRPCSLHDAEVDQVDAAGAVLDQDVRGLDVTVDDLGARAQRRARRRPGRGSRARRPARACRARSVIVARSDPFT